MSHLNVPNPSQAQAVQPERHQASPAPQLAYVSQPQQLFRFPSLASQHLAPNMASQSMHGHQGMSSQRVQTLQGHVGAPTQPPTRSVMPILEEVEQRCVRTEGLCTENKSCLEKLHNDLASALRSLTEAQLELSSCVSRIGDLEKRTSTIEDQLSSDKSSTKAIETEFKKGLQTLERRVDIVLHSSIKTDSRLSKAQSAHEDKVSRLCDQSDAKLQELEVQLANAKERLIKQEAKTSTFMESMLVPFFGAFQEVVPRSKSAAPRSPTQDRQPLAASEAQASAEAAAEALKLVIGNISKPLGDGDTSTSTTCASSEGFQPMACQVTDDGDRQSPRPAPECRKDPKRKRSDSFDHEISLAAKKPHQQAQLEGPERQIHQPVAQDGQKEVAAVALSTQHLTPSSDPALGAPGAESMSKSPDIVSAQALDANQEDQGPTADQVSLSDQREPSESESRRHAAELTSKMRQMSASEDDQRDGLQDTPTSLPVPRTAKLKHASQDDSENCRCVLPSKQAQDPREAPIARQSRLKTLKDRSVQPSQVKEGDAFFTFARLGRWTRETPLVVTESPDLKYSLISDVLANALLRDRTATTEQSRDTIGDRWIRVDLAWQFDADRRQSEGPRASFEQHGVLFLVVSKEDMHHGIILAKTTLDDLGLQIGYSDTCRSHFVARDGRLAVGKLLDTFPLDKLNSELSNPFARLCRLAEFAATRKKLRRDREAGIRPLPDRNEKRGIDDARRAYDTYRGDQAKA